jgi:hypothetical protein
MALPQHQDLIRVKMALWAAMVILMVAEISYVLQSVLGSLTSIIVTLAIFLVHWLFNRYLKSNPWAKAFSIFVRLLVVFAPLIYLLVQIFVFESHTLWLQSLLVLSFIVPLLLIYYSCRIVQQMLDESASTL